MGKLQHFSFIVIRRLCSMLIIIMESGINADILLHYVMGRAEATTTTSETVAAAEKNDNNATETPLNCRA